MRLWHQALIHYLDNRRLLGQYRECCALRGKGWGRKHATVDYVFKHDLAHLYEYHCLVMHELVKRNRNTKIDNKWLVRTYRGKNLPIATRSEVGTYVWTGELIYAEHNDSYLKECLLNLKSKGADLVNGKTIDEMLIDIDLKEKPV